MAVTVADIAGIFKETAADELTVTMTVKDLMNLLSSNKFALDMLLASKQDLLTQASHFAISGSKIYDVLYKEVERTGNGAAKLLMDEQFGIYKRISRHLKEPDTSLMS